MALGPAACVALGPAAVNSDAPAFSLARTLETHLTLVLRRLVALSSCCRGVVVVLVVVVVLENLRKLGAVALLLLSGEAEASEHWV